MDDRIDELRAAGREVLALSAYPKRTIPEAILREAWSFAATMEHPPTRGLVGLREALAKFLAPRSKHPIDPSTEILITCGAMHAIICGMMAIVEPGDEVLVFTPSYFFEGSITLPGARMIPVPLLEDDAFRWRVDLLEKAVTPRTRAILLNTPNNPTGTVADEQLLASIAALAERHNLYILCDESYDQLVYDGRTHQSILSVSANRDRNILVGSFTKSFAMAAWRVGYLVASRQVIDAALKALEWTWLFGPFVNQKLAELVLRSDRHWLAGVKDEFQKNRELMSTELREIASLSFVSPEGNPFFFLNVSRFAPDDTAISHRLLEQHGIPCNAGALHGAAGYIRVPFGGAPQTIREAALRLRSAFGAFSERH
jgi:aspartate/methionine/tyrosine aminotransferase